MNSVETSGQEKKSKSDGEIQMNYISFHTVLLILKLLDFDGVGFR